MYRRTSFSSDEDAARDYLENLPPVPDESQAPGKLPARPPAPPAVKVDYPVGREGRDDEPEYPPPPPYTPPPLGPKPRPFLRGTGSKVLDAIIPIFGWLLMVAPLVAIAALLWRGLSGVAGRLFAKPTPAPTAAQEQVDGPYTADDVRQMLGDVPYAPQPAPSATSAPAGPWGSDHTTNEVIGSLSRTVYWTADGKSYHFNDGCPSLSNSKVETGTLAEAMESGYTDPCDNCVPQ